MAATKLLKKLQNTQIIGIRRNLSEPTLLILTIFKTNEEIKNYLKTFDNSSIPQIQFKKFIVAKKDLKNLTEFSRFCNDYILRRDNVHSYKWIRLYEKS